MMHRVGTPNAPEPAHAEPDRGISLAELLVAVMLTVISGLIVLSLFLSSTTAIAIGGAAHSDTGTASNLMNSMSRVIRSGVLNQDAGVSNPPLIVAKPTSLQMYSLVDMAAAGPMRPVKVELTVNAAGELVEKRWQASLAADGSWTFPASAPLILNRTLPGKILASGAGNPSDLFSYVKADGSVLVAPAGGLSAAQLAEIVAVKVSVAVRASTNTGKNPAVISAQVGMPNLGISRSDVR